MEACWPRLGCVGFGAEVLLDVEVVEEPEGELEVDVDELEDDDPEDDALELEEVTGGVVVVEVVVAGAQDSLSDTTTPWIGRFIAEIGVPGGKLTLNV